MLKESGTNLFFLSEVKHIFELESFLLKRQDIEAEGGKIIALDAQVEYALAQKGMPFTSGYEYRTRDASAYTLAEEWAGSIFNSPAWAFFSYRKVSLSRIYFFPFQTYMPLMLYFGDMISNALRAHPGSKRVIGFSFAGPVPAAGFSLEQSRLRVVTDLISEIARQNKKEPLIVASVSAEKSSHTSFFVKRALFEVLMGVCNVLIRAARPRKKIRILASDYWRNLYPYVRNIESAEIVMIDRIEGFRAGFKNILKYRINFLHPSRRLRSQEATDAGVLIEKTYASLKETNALPLFVCREVSYYRLIVSVLDQAVRHAVDKTLEDIDNTYAFLARERPDVVILRSTMSGQTHFVILAEVARNLGIASLEMQHGIEYYGPGSMDRRHSAKFMGVYGPLTAKEMREGGDTRVVPIVIGSPRFDVYASIPPKADEGGKVSVLCVGPSIFPVFSTDSYEMIAYFTALRDAMKGLSNARTIIKLRPRIAEKKFFETILRELFKGMDYSVAELEPLHELYVTTDIVVSLYSTAAFEAMQAKRPLIYLGLSPEQKLMGEQHLPVYEQAGALYNADSTEKLREYLSLLVNSADERTQAVKRASAFLTQAYAFDGKAGERAAKLIEDIAAKKNIDSDWHAF